VLKAGEVEAVPAEAGESPHRLVENSAAQRQLGHVPRQSRLCGSQRGAVLRVQGPQGGDRLSRAGRDLRLLQNAHRPPELALGDHAPDAALHGSSLGMAVRREVRGGSQAGVPLQRAGRGRRRVPDGGA